MPNAFSAYLSRYKGRDTPLGDFADDAARDRDFPDIKSEDQLMTYLDAKGACDEAVAVARRAWRRYAKARAIEAKHEKPRTG